MKINLVGRPRRRGGSIEKRAIVRIRQSAFRRVFYNFSMPMGICAASAGLFERRTARLFA
jgi:hypothetical protein